MKRLFLVTLLFFVSAGRAAPESGLTFVYQTTDRILYAEILFARHWENFFTLTGDTHAAIWFAGYAAHAQKQFDESHKL